MSLVELGQLFAGNLTEAVLLVLGFRVNRLVGNMIRPLRKWL